MYLKHLEMTANKRKTVEGKNTNLTRIPQNFEEYFNINATYI